VIIEKEWMKAEFTFHSVFGSAKHRVKSSPTAGNRAWNFSFLLLLLRVFHNLRGTDGTLHGKYGGLKNTGKHGHDEEEEWEARFG
jgi:hypothetical protein